MAKFLLVTHIYPPAIDGGSKVIHKLGQYFQQQGHQIMVLTSDCSSTDDFTQLYRSKAPKFYSSNVFRLPVYTIFHRILKPFSKVLSKGPIFKFIPFLWFLISCLRFHPDYIIAGPLPTTIILYASFIKKLTGAKLLINASFHPSDPEFSQPLLINALKSADYIWTLTDFETIYFHQNFGIPLSIMINVGNGVDKKFLTKAPKSYRSNALSLLFVGSFAAHKGINTLIEAFSTIYDLNPNYSLTLAGQPTLYRPNINSKIKVIHNFKSKDLKLLLDQSSILISPSTQESFGLVLIEAWARGVPVIAADIPASSELITKTKGGLLFKVNDAQDLASKILQLHSSNALKLECATHGFNYVKTHYTWDKIGNTIWQKISS